MEIKIQCGKEIFNIHEQVLGSDKDQLQAIDEYYNNFNKVHLVGLSIDGKYLCQTSGHTGDNVFSYNKIFKMSIIPPFKIGEQVGAGSDLNDAVENYRQGDKFYYFGNENGKHILTKVIEGKTSIVRMNNIYCLKQVTDNDVYL